MATKIEYTEIKYIPTGNVFKLPVEEAKEVLETDRGNFEIVGGVDIPEEKQTVEETTTYNMVVDTTTEATPETNNVPQVTETTVPETVEETTTTTAPDTTAEAEKTKFTKTALKSKSVNELVELCEARNIEVSEDDKKANLIDKLLAAYEE